MINIISRVINRNKMMNIRIKNKNALGDLNERMKEQKPFDADDFKVDQLKMQLRKGQLAESHIQEGMSLLQQKRKAVDELKDMSKDLKKLSEKYNDVNCTEDEKEKIEKNAREIINSMDNIMNDIFGDKSLFAGRQVSIETSHGSNIVVRGNLDISLNFYGDDGHKSEDIHGIHIEGDLSIVSILENTAQIEKKLIKPLDDASDEIKSQMVSVVNDAMYQDMIVEMAAKGLADLKEIDVYTKSKIINNSKDILENAAEALYCQSSNLDRKRTSALLT
jgi:flagellin-like hook-associated protein FlgL